MSPQEVIEKMNLRFQSGNSVPVESSRITKEEWDVVKSLLKDENDGLAKQETILTHLKALWQAEALEAFLHKHGTPANRLKEEIAELRRRAEGDDQ